MSGFQDLFQGEKILQTENPRRCWKPKHSSQGLQMHQEMKPLPRVKRGKSPERLAGSSRRRGLKKQPKC